MTDINEIAYLEKTLSYLTKAYKELSSNITDQDHNFKSLQKYMVEYKSELDKFEVYDYQQTLSMIDKRGFAQVMEREEVRKLIESPYFGRFDFIYLGDHPSEAETIYIGRFGFADEEGTQLIYDWRAPICNMYYEFEIGEAYYIAMDHQFDGELIKKRQIKIENSKLKYMLDSSLTIQDEVLQQTLTQHANDKMKTIVTSIQREQNKIVRNESAYNVIIQGVAGSGKTAVALHRIAYYLYKFRDTLRAERIFILSPNKIFSDYISTVLPELGEEPIRSFTLDEFTANLLPAAVTFKSFEEETKEILSNPDGALASRAKIKGNYSFVQKLQSFLSNLDLRLLKNESISIVGVVIQADYLQGRFLQYRKEPVVTRLELMADDIIQVLKSKWDREGKLPSKNEIIKRLKKRLLFPSPLAIYRAFTETLRENSFKFPKKCFEFNDVYPYLFVQLYFKGIKQYDLVQHFVLDEMQEYSPIQYAVLSKVFTCKRTIIGDFSQALLPYETISKEAFEAMFRNLEYVELTTTYRSSYEIVMYSKKFMRNGEIHPIARHGKEPKELIYLTLEQMLKQVHESAMNDYRTTAIICKMEEDLQILHERLNIPFTILDGQTEKFETGLLLTTIQYAKGLEFDAVIIPFVNETNYRTEFDRGLLYIASTRAMHELTVLVDKEAPSPLL
ncbi:ATP-binding domain-containing protein [Bacillus sp. AGMB 02131]|uniref:ATP-binding domain-containing protein n=1 Tax=Peribacillus faecalis TaxID=2772559 RepID=A0A927CYV7_9BACI|nr:ATP-binding domain-containing protein [Peribacillus faecalis]MBD3109197.1 ATP-binding domain-containing protein [Peribacillus faecalis]